MNTNTPQKAVVFNGNIDFTNQIIVMKQRAMGYRSRCEGKAISLYRNGELLADGTMSTGQIEGGAYPSLCAAGLTYHDDTFESFSADDTYTLTIGDEEPIGMAFVNDSKILTQELYDGLNPHILGVDNIWNLRGNGYSTFSIAQNVQTTKKKYDIKLLPEELLPKSVAKKSEVKSVERVANNALDIANSAQSTAQTAQSTAESAQSTAESAQSTAESAQSTAESAQSTAESAQSTANSAKTTANSAKTTAESAKTTAESAKTTAESAKTTAESAKTTAQNAQSTANSAKTTVDSLNTSAVKTSNGYSYKFNVRSDSSQYPELIMSDYSQHREVIAKIDENIGLILRITRDGGTQDGNTIYNPATIKVVNSAGTGGVVIDGLRSIIMTSSTPNSTKQFKITVDDTGTISATEVTSA